MTMRGTIKLLAVILAALCAASLAGVLTGMSGSRQARPDIVAINDMAMTLREDADISPEQVADHILLLYDRMAAEQRVKENHLKIWLCALVVLMAAAAIGMLLYADRRVLRPFVRMRQFAGQIAAGNLDAPLDMDKGGGFGAYTESLDLMRSELKRAREAEAAAGRSKKELVASLSHDVKTPVASIKAVAELMEVTASDEKQRTRARTISDKADQIGRLVDGMFQATLEELQELEVRPGEVASTEIRDLIRSADYAGKAEIGPVPDCVAIADAYRLAQVFDNLLSNSYKYAGTAIRVDAAIEDARLVLRFIDSGGGAPPEELPLLTQKFYRGGNAQGKDGAGLGLYISCCLVERMGGRLSVDNIGDGFMVQVMVKLA